MKELKVRLTTTDEMLGSSPADKEIYSTYIGSLAPDALKKEEEVEMLGAEEVAEKGTTVFRRDKDENPIILDYMIKGFFKNSCSALRKVGTTSSSKIKAFKKEIDGLIFIKEREIKLQLPSPLTICQRPLRASTAQGERVALASSEAAPAGTVMEFTIQMLYDDHEKVIREWLDYGALNGLGQWHNGGKGRFQWEEIK